MVNKTKNLKVLLVPDKHRNHTDYVSGKGNGESCRRVARGIIFFSFNKNANYVQLNNWTHSIAILVRLNSLLFHVKLIDIYVIILYQARSFPRTHTKYRISVTQLE